MKKVVNNETVAHLWAYQSQEEARNQQGNFYFDGKTIYSYGRHFPICTIHEINGEKWYFFTKRKYSNTTAKHIGIALNSIPCRSNIVYVYNVPIYDLYANTENVQKLSADIVETKKKANRAKINKDYLNREASAQIANLKRYCELTGAAMPDIFISKTFDLEGYIKEKEDRERERRKIENRERREKLENDIKNWRDGCRVYLYGLPFDLLRVNGDKVETSRGVSVDKRIVKILWCMLQDGKNVVGRHVEHFTIKEVTDKIVKIGCHTFEMNEVKNLILQI